MGDIQKIHAKKSLGQHFLTSAIVPSWMCDAADIVSSDTVLEIGPGTGVLTKELLSRGATVVALETDLRAIEVLQETFQTEIAQGSLILHHTDVRTLDLATLPGISNHSFKVVANIPYYLSGFLFRTFLESGVQPTDLIYLVQKEVAKRITTDLKRKEKESLLSLSVKVYGDPKYVKTVTRGHFTPPPKVDSGIIAIRNITKNNFKDIEESLFFNILHLGFGQKRKQLLGNLSKHYSRDTLTHIFSTVDIPVSARAEDIPLEKWLTLVKELSFHN
jgi:16S rRNA (adenine1518-N6/adenine1519-N6)-dimethyltransferase